MISFPNCKVNLGLHVTSKRPDGYHNIETVLFPAGMYDVLEIIPSAKAGFHLSGLPIPGIPGENLVNRALQLIGEIPGRKFDIYLYKAIPPGSGLGGGSSDGAFALKMFNELMRKGLDGQELKMLAADLGSDCAFFIDNQPAYASGKGDILEPIQINLSGYYLGLVIPDIMVSTREAYSDVVPAPAKTDLRELGSVAVGDWKNMLVNDFERTVIARYPAIGKIKTRLYELGAVYASMSGSGSAVYGIFKEKADLTEHFESCRVWINQIK